MSDTQVQPPVVKKANSGNAVASVILGAVGFFLWIPVSWAGFSLAVLALILGIYALKRKEPQKVPAIIGIVLGSLGIVVSGIAMLVGLLIGSAALNSVIESNPESSPTESGPQIAKIGEPAVDGTFTFTVNDMECGITTVGTEYLNTTAQGQYCRFGVTVTNTGQEPQYMFAANQQAFDAAGREFAQDSTPGMYDDGSKVWMTEINPGNSVTGNIYFDIPTTTTLSRLKLHDSTFSEGVTVQLN